MRTNLWVLADSTGFETVEKLYMRDGAQSSAVALLLIGAAYGWLPACFDV